MKERPILFSAPMVQAILDGRKTQTRRIIKWPVYSETNAGTRKVFLPDRRIERINELLSNTGRSHPHDVVKCPYGQPGDQLWVRETHCFTVDDASFGQPFNGAMKRAFESKGIAHAQEYEWVIYRADNANPDLDGDVVEWRPSIHMPRWASRIDLKIVSVRAERLFDISREDAAAEGICYLSDERRAGRYLDKMKDGTFVVQYGMLPEENFLRLFEKINGPGNPWVWRIEFEKVRP